MPKPNWNERAARAFTAATIAGSGGKLHKRGVTQALGVTFALCCGFQNAFGQQAAFKR
jgi:hypothetical protein